MDTHKMIDMTIGVLLFMALIGSIINASKTASTNENASSFVKTIVVLVPFILVAVFITSLVKKGGGR